MKTPLKIADVAPVYPAIARNARIQGVVILEAVLNAQGGVESVRVLRSIPLLDQAAVDAVQQWRFTPALSERRARPGGHDSNRQFHPEVISPIRLSQRLTLRGPVSEVQPQRSSLRG